MEWRIYIVALRRTHNNSDELQQIFLNTDMGSAQVLNLPEKCGIQLTTTCPQTPEPSMVIGRVSRTIGESAIAMLLTATSTGKK